MTDLEDRVRRALTTIATDVDAPEDLAAVEAAVIGGAAESVEVRRPPRRRLWFAAAAIAAVGLGGVWTIAYQSNGRSGSLASTPHVASVTRTIDGLGTLTVTTGDDGTVCLTPALDIGGGGAGCVDRAVYESGELWGAVTSPLGAVLFGVAPAGDAVRVEIAGRTITADADGFWWTDLDGTETSFTIVTADDRHEERLEPATASGATSSTVAATDAPSTSSPVPAAMTGALTPALDVLPDGLVPIQASDARWAPTVVDQPVRLRTTIARYSGDRTTVERFVTFEVSLAMNDRQFAERFGRPTATGEQVDGSPLLVSPADQLVWREGDRVVSVDQGPSKMSDAEIAAVASGAQRRADGALDVVDPPDGWEQIEMGANLAVSSGSQWRVDYGGPRSSEADTPELMVTRVDHPMESAEVGLLDVYEAHAIDVDGQRMIVTSRPWMFRRSVQVAWDDPDGWQTTLEYRPLDDLRPVAELEQTVVEIARNLRPVGTDDWSRLVDEATANATQRNHAAWLPGVLAANQLTPRGDVTISQQMAPVFVVPVARADGSTTICEIARRQLTACHDTDTTDGAALIDAQTVRVATTDPAVTRANVISPDGTMGLGFGPTGDGVAIAYATFDPTRAAPDCVELRNDDNEPLGTIPISPATTCTTPPG